MTKPKTPNYSHLLPPSWKSQVSSWLTEDAPSFNYGGSVAFLWGKGSKPAVLAGMPLVDEIFPLLDCTYIRSLSSYIVEWHVAEGDEFEPIRHIATCSGIATVSKHTKDLAESYGFRGVIAGTRKTTAGFRLVEKYGMIVGGIDPHRFDLSSMIVLKDNHIWLAGSVTAVISHAHEVGGFSLLLTVEVRDEEEANEAIAAGVDVIMLDNIEGDELVSVACGLRDRWEGKGKKFLLKMSGGVTITRIVWQVDGYCV
ncbi:Quinolinate phosphoribosyl transferase [Lactarius deliciosus]|nr:Quinolinate phosphoribosyl transferase [Lactarius deliciosus]